MQQIISTLKQFKQIHNDLCFLTREQLLGDIQKYLKENNIVAFRWEQGHFFNDGDSTYFGTRYFSVLIDTSVDIFDLEKVDEAFIHYEDIDEPYTEVVRKLVETLEDANDSLEQIGFGGGDIVEITVYRDAQPTIYSDF
jgi:hypothetical protein